MNEIRDMLGSKMSTGMKQKVSIARTIVHDPPVLIFDEPTSGLDVLVARAVLKTIDSCKEQGKCIIFSTHIMREVEKLCDRVAIIHRGRILAWARSPNWQTSYGQPDIEELFFELIQRHDETADWMRLRETRESMPKTLQVDIHLTPASRAALAPGPRGVRRPRPEAYARRLAATSTSTFRWKCNLRCSPKTSN